MEQGNFSGEPAIGALDDLLALMARPDRLRAALEGVPDPATIIQNIPPAVLRLAMAVAWPPSYQSMVQNHPEAADRLASARDFVVTALPGLALASAVQPAVIAASADDGRRGADLVRGLRSVGHANLWFGRRDALVPAVRVVLTDNAGEPAFDGILDWTDIIFVADSLLKVLADSINDGGDLVASKNVGSFIDALSQSEESITATLQEIVAAAGKLRSGDRSAR
jgi:hypothetical protein